MRIIRSHQNVQALFLFFFTRFRILYYSHRVVRFASFNAPIADIIFISYFWQITATVLWCPSYRKPPSRAPHSPRSGMHRTTASSTEEKVSPLQLTLLAYLFTHFCLWHRKAEQIYFHLVSAVWALPIEKGSIATTKKGNVRARLTPASTSTGLVQHKTGCQEKNYICHCDFSLCFPDCVCLEIGNQIVNVYKMGRGGGNVNGK